MSTKVINIRTYQGEYTYIGRGSPFGNPYKIGKGQNRDDVLIGFSIYFEKRLDCDPSFKEAVEGLKGKTLGCYCAPLPCHGDIIADWLDNTK